jgi:hypothetical protein
MAISTLKNAVDFTLPDYQFPQLYAENVRFGAAISGLSLPVFGRFRRFRDRVLSTLSCLWRTAALRRKKLPESEQRATAKQKRGWSPQGVDARHD